MPACVLLAVGFERDSLLAALGAFAEGALLLFLGDHERAVACYRHAVAFDPGDDPEQRKRQLTLQSELAMTLERAGRPAEAEQVYLDGLERRADFYGREHAGYAFGLEPYGSFLARRGELDRALPLAQEAAENLDRNQHPRLAQVDLAYHDINRSRGLFHLLQRRGLIRRWVTEEQIAQSIAEGPRTRARVRGGFIRAAREAGQDFTVDWVHLRINQRPDLSHVCQDPFAASDPAVEETVRTLVGRRAPADPPEDQAGVPLV